MAQSSMDQKGFVEKREESAVALPTPQKSENPLRIEISSTEKCKDLLEYFDGMVCSIRLLTLCGKAATLSNVSAQVEILKKRKFLYRHLAQIKCILPEAVAIHKLIVHDRRTLCMRPDIKILLSFSGMPLRELFISRIVDSSLHIKRYGAFGVLRIMNLYDIPEATLPDPFCQGGQVTNQAYFASNLVMLPQSNISDVGKPSASQLLQCFKRAFSNEPDIHRSGPDYSALPRHCEDGEEQPQDGHDYEDVIRAASDAIDNQDVVDGIGAESDAVHNQNGRIEQAKESISCAPTISILLSLEVANPCCSAASIASNSPAVKLASSVESSMVETPAQMTPKRSMPSSVNILKSKSIQNVLSCHKNTKRSLDFFSEDGSNSTLEGLGKCVNIPENSSQHSDRMEVKNKFGAAAVLPLSRSKEEEHISKDRNGTEAKLRISEQMSSCLPGIVATICHVYVMVGNSSITKEELVHKILMNNFEIEERRAAEEQIELLEKLVPDWIWRTTAASGDILYSIRKGPTIKSVISRLGGC